jgi:hypothetical protein
LRLAAPFMLIDISSLVTLVRRVLSSPCSITELFN